MMISILLPADIARYARQPRAPAECQPAADASAGAPKIRPCLLFGVEIEACARCGGKLKVIASIEEPAVIAKILAHLERTAPDQYQPELPLGARAPPAQSPLP